MAGFRFFASPAFSFLRYKCCWAMGWIVKLSHKSQILKFTFSHGEFWGYTGRWDTKLSLNIRTETNIWINTILWLMTVYHNHHLCSKKKSIEKWKYKNKRKYQLFVEGLLSVPSMSGVSQILFIILTATQYCVHLNRWQIKSHRKEADVVKFMDFQFSESFSVLGIHF